MNQLKTMTEIEIKAAIYDQLCIQNQASSNIKILEQELLIRKQDSYIKKETKEN